MIISKEIIKKNHITISILTQKEENILNNLYKKCSKLFNQNRVNTKIPMKDFTQTLKSFEQWDELSKILEKARKYIKYKYSYRDALEIIWDCSDIHYNLINDNEIINLFIENGSIRKQYCSERWITKHISYIKYIYNKFPDFDDYDYVQRKHTKDYNKYKKNYGVAFYTIYKNEKKLPRCIGYIDKNGKHQDCPNHSPIIRVDVLKLKGIKYQGHCNPCSVRENERLIKIKERHIKEKKSYVKEKDFIKFVQNELVDKEQILKSLKEIEQKCYKNGNRTNLYNKITGFYLIMKDKYGIKAGLHEELEKKVFSLYKLYVNNYMLKKYITNNFCKRLCDINYTKQYGNRGISSSPKIKYKKIIEFYPVIKDFLLKYDNNNGKDFKNYLWLILIHLYQGNPLPYCETCGKPIFVYGSNYKYCNRKCNITNYHNSSKYALKVNKKYIYFDSSWELIYYYMKSKQNKIIRNPGLIQYKMNKKTHYYLPDFKVGKQYIEIKGDQFVKTNKKGQIIGLCNPYIKEKDKRYKDAQKLAMAKYKCMKQNKVKILSKSDIISIRDKFNKQFNYNPKGKDDSYAKYFEYQTIEGKKVYKISGKLAE